ncbi:hypothetical protein CDD83_5391 [Cordyceps sp. RAO-2017]|nr:hypothetical protein CDD83_5391 [Cordyceps sp. RAO-2017]
MRLPFGLLILAALSAASPLTVKRQDEAAEVAPAEAAPAEAAPPELAPAESAPPEAEAPAEGEAEPAPAEGEAEPAPAGEEAEKAPAGEEANPEPAPAEEEAEPPAEEEAEPPAEEEAEPPAEEEAEPPAEAETEAPAEEEGAEEEDEPDEPAPPSPIDVKLEMVNGSQAKATFTNKGPTSLKVLKTGSIFDEMAAEKVKIWSGETPVEFRGAVFQLSTENLTEEDFQRLEPNAPVSVTIDIAQLHDLSAGGKFGVMADGALSVAAEQGTELTGSVAFTSNRLEADVDGPAAAAALAKFSEQPERRTDLLDDCRGDRLQVASRVLPECAQLARAAARAARSGPAAKMTEYFTSSSRRPRRTVADVFDKVARECGSTRTGASTYHCRDPFRSCGPKVLAYTMPDRSTMVYCDLYHQSLREQNQRCHAQDKVGVNVHEITHLRQVKGTSDLGGGYGYAFVRSLRRQDNLRHADTYSLFAQSIQARC